MTSNIEVVENIISKRHQDILEEMFLSNNFPMFFNKTTLGDSYTEEDVFFDNNTVDTPQFTHMLANEGNATGPYNSHVIPIYIELCNQLNADYSLYRAKINLTYPNINYTTDQYHPPHRDLRGGNPVSAIYYINDSDGDTVFFNDKKEIVQRVSPKKGSLVYFDSEMWHAGRPPINSTVRAVINFILIPKL